MRRSAVASRVRSVAARVTTRERPAPPAGRRDRGVAILAILALAWLAATLWSAHATIVGSGDAVLALIDAALALPTVIAASLLGGGAVGLAAVALLTRRAPAAAARWPVRYGAGLAGGLAVGLAGAALVLMVYGTPDAILVLAAALGGASLLGGIMAGVRPARAVAAALAGLLAWFAVGVIQGLFSGHLLNVFGAGSTAASQDAASKRLWLAIAVLGGIVAGAAAYAYLRRAQGDEPWRWPVYLVAGGGPGLLLLAADLVTIVGGAQLLRVVGSISPFDRAVVAFLNESRIKTGLVVFFAGALTALLAFGRTLGSAPEEDADPPTSDA
jgi:hypothetical protein